MDRILQPREIERERNRLLWTFSAGLPQMIRLPDCFRSFLPDSRFVNLVDMYALPLFSLMSLNGKTLPAFEIFLQEEKIGRDEELPRLVGRTVYGASSGNTATGWAFLSPLFKIKQFVAVVDKTISPGKKGQLQVAGAGIVYPPPGVSTIDYAHELGRQPNSWKVNQYTHRGSVDAHEKWTMPHIRQEMFRLGTTPSAIFLPTGTTSTLVAAKWLKRFWPKMRIVGVACVSEEEKVPGARTEAGLAVTTFDYRKALDWPLVLCGKKASYEMSLELYRRFIPAGPTSGFALAGSFQYLQRRYDEFGMDGMRDLYNNEGRIVLVYVFMDTFLAYSDEYAEVLSK